MSAGEARENGAKIARILRARDGAAELYRTVTAGPSGQRADLLVGKVHYTWVSGFEVEIIDCSDGQLAGYACRDHDGGWLIWELPWDGLIRWLGSASSLSAGADVLINGPHAALARHDSSRVSPGTFTSATACADQHAARARAKSTPSGGELA